MPQIISNFLTEDNGQDLIEYSLLIAFVVLGSSLSGVWTVANTRLATANTIASS